MIPYYKVFSFDTLVNNRIFERKFTLFDLLREHDIQKMLKSLDLWSLRWIGILVQWVFITLILAFKIHDSLIIRWMSIDCLCWGLLGFSFLWVLLIDIISTGNLGRYNITGLSLNAYWSGQWFFNLRSFSILRIRLHYHILSIGWSPKHPIMLQSSLLELRLNMVKTSQECIW